MKTSDKKPLFVFWDCQCLNDGQNWLKGFVNGIQTTQIIVLIVSASVSISFSLNSFLTSYRACMELRKLKTTKIMFYLSINCSIYY